VGGLGHQCGPVDPVEPTREVDHRFGEQSTEQADLLLLAGATGVEILAQGLVLDVVPTHPHPQPKPASGQEIDISRLPSHQGRLALGKDQDPGGEPDSLGDAGQVGEHYERIVERVVLGVGAYQLRGPVGMDGAEGVLVGEEMLEAQLFHGQPESPHGDRITPEFDLGIDNADFHE
jgi:hypothetical protein